MQNQKNSKKDNGIVPPLAGEVRRGINFRGNICLRPVGLFCLNCDLCYYPEDYDYSRN